MDKKSLSIPEKCVHSHSDDREIEVAVDGRVPMRHGYFSWNLLGPCLLIRYKISGEQFPTE